MYRSSGEVGKPPAPKPLSRRSAIGDRYLHPPPFTHPRTSLDGGRGVGEHIPPRCRYIQLMGGGEKGEEVCLDGKEVRWWLGGSAVE